MSTGGSSMSAMLYQAAGMLAICVIFLIVWVTGCRKSQDRILENMQTPLLSGESVEHRIDAATREAEAGFTVCRGCEFENFKRFSYCSLCGEKLPSVGDEDGTSSSRSTTTSELTAASDGSAQLMRQQTRARRRKEWSRKLDVDGNLFWYRGCVNGVESQFPAVTVLFTKPLVEQKDLPPASETTAENQGESSVVVATPTPTQTLTPVQKLLKMDEVVKMELIPSSEANPAVFPTGATLESKERIKEVVDVVAQDFPTKYAHFVVSTAALITPAEVEFLKLSVHREFMLEESVDHLACIEQKNIRSFMRIT
ncbi:Hect ubiquitin ligase, partial [Globisporangium polare]